jgi:hypothetical protein
MRGLPGRTGAIDEVEAAARTPMKLPFAVQVLRQRPALAGNVVGDLTVLTADGPAFVAPHPATDLLLTVTRSGHIARRLLLIPEPRPEHGECCRAIAMLRPLAFASDTQARWTVRDHDAAFYFVAVLTAWTRTFGRRPFKVSVLQNERGINGLRQDSDCHCAGMNAAFTFGRWDTLPAMAARFVRERLTRFWAAYLEDNYAWALLNQFKVKDPSAECGGRTRGVAR